MQLIDEQDDAALALLHLGQHRFQPLLKFAAELGAGHQSAHIQRKDGLILQVFRHVPGHNPQGQPFGDGGFADARLPDQAGVVLGFAGKDADDVADLLVPPDDGVQLLAAGGFGQVAAVFFQHVVGVLGAVGGHAAVAAYLPQRRQEFFLRQAAFPEQGFQGVVGLGKQPQHQVLHRGVLIVHLPGNLFGLVQRLLQAAGKVHLSRAAAGNLRQPFHRGGQLLPQSGGIRTGLLYQLTDQALPLFQQGQQQMLLLDLLVLPFAGHLLSSLNGLYAFLGKLVEIHSVSSSSWIGRDAARPLYGHALPLGIVPVQPLDLAARGTGQRFLFGKK